MSNQNPKLDSLTSQAQAYVQDQYNRPVIVTSAVLCYEVIDPSEDGRVYRTIDYISLTDHPSFSSDYGVVAVVQAQLIAVGVEMGEENGREEEEEGNDE